jgi:hypothetical protein
MSITIYVVSAVLVFIFSGLLAMAGLGAAFLFVPLFYYLGVPLAEATPTALLLNVVSLLFAAITFWPNKQVYWPECNPTKKHTHRILITDESWKARVYPMFRLHEIKTRHIKRKM